MATTFNIVIIGAGPGGLAAALSLAKHPSSKMLPIHITLLELRQTIQTVGGTVNMTPLALRYLDSLGAGKRLRPRGSTVSAIELVAHRTAKLIARLWPNVDALRVRRQALGESLLETLQQEVDPQIITIEYGAKVLDIEQYGSAEREDGGVRVTWTKSAGAGDTPKSINANLVIGSDGIHSQVRRHVEPARAKEYSGKSFAYGFIPITQQEAAKWKRADGKPLINDTTLVRQGSQTFIMTYYEAPGARTGLYLAAVIPLEEATGGSREGWAARNADKAALKSSISNTFAGGNMDCLTEIIGQCDDWFLFPVYTLSPNGLWSSGRILLIGDAGHAMPPQGESAGIAIEDGVLLAHVLSRRGTRNVAQLLADYEKLRRDDINAAYKSSLARWGSNYKPGWLSTIYMEWVDWVGVTYLNYSSEHFKRDVRDLPLPE
ncbi:hypothetical protein K4F52_000488 [Lecanicillium sp. MT-2017a]|nr:hypothetical protein K4F52_000488 [Lecanicillium sp. MT-2017a]